MFWKYKSPLGRAVAKRIFFIGIALLAIGSFTYLKKKSTKIEQAVVLAYRKDATAESKDELADAAYDAIYMIKSAGYVALFGIPVIYVLALLAAKPVADIHEFFRGLSHDIKNLLSGYTLNIEKYDDKLQTAEETIEAIRPISENIVEVFNKQDDIIKNFTGKTKTKAERIDLCASVRFVTEFYKPRAEVNGVSLTCSLPENAITLNAHRDKIDQILFNLISNAVKYTPKGSIAVSLSRAVYPYVKLVVEDTGIAFSAYISRHWKSG